MIDIMMSEGVAVAVGDSGRIQRNYAINWSNWVIVREMAIAAHDGDIQRLRGAAHRLDSEIPLDDHAGIYIFYLLWRRADIIGRRAADRDFQTVALRAHRNTARIVKLSVDDVEDTIRVAFRASKSQGDLSGNDFMVNGVIVLGALLDRVPDDIDALLPKLDDWYHRTFPNGLQ